MIVSGERIGKWNDAPCSSKRGYICQTNKGVFLKWNIIVKIVHVPLYYTSMYDLTITNMNKSYHSIIIDIEMQ